MFANMKLGAKIAVGFGALIAIAMILGGLAVVQMKRVVGDSVKLADEYAPEAMISSTFERRVWRTMYNMRGYNYTGEKTFYDAGMAAMSQVKETLVEAEKLAAEAVHLTQLKQHLEEAKKAVTTYEKFVVQTDALVTGQAQLAADMREKAGKYMQNSADFLKSQNEAMSADIAAAAPAENLLERLKKINLINDIIDQGNNARIANLMSRANRDNQIMAEGIKTIFTVIEEKGSELDAIVRSSEDRQKLKEVLAAAHEYKAGMQKYLDASLELDRINTARVETADVALEIARNLMKASIGQTHEIADQAASSLDRASTIVLTGLAVALAIGILLAVFITRSITLPIHRIIEGLNDGSEQVASASGQVSSASQSLAEGATQQAASIEETSASLEEMSSMTKQNADNARQADGLMGESRQVVDTANLSMDKLTSSMEEITRASEETSKIIKTIDEIAFQTNLLALNAAVEAARAGEAGAGFAVVADEVRNLALRAADAAKNTASLIEGTVKKVKEGSGLVVGTNEAFKQVAVSSAKVAGLVGEIAAASKEQAQGIEEVNKAVTEMDKVTQQNAANAEESASASEEMNAQAEQMRIHVQSLVALVGGGNGNNGNGYHGHGNNGNGFHARGIHLHPGEKSKALSVPAHAIKRKRPMSNLHEIDPEQVIPMDDDDFKNF